MLSVFDLQWSYNGGQNGDQIENSWKYIMWGIKIDDLKLQVYLPVFDLQRPPWSNNGG